MKKKNIILVALGLALALASFYFFDLARISASGVAKSSQTEPDVRSMLNLATTARAAGRGNPWINFMDGHSAPAIYLGQSSMAEQLKENQSRPVALASADFDEDGVPDLIVGHSAAGAGAISLQRGDADTIYPNTVEALNHRAQMKTLAKTQPPQSDIQSPFLASARVFDIPGSPEFLAAGDFDGDGHMDIVSTETGAEELHLLSGDGQGGFAAARSISLPGKVTDLIAGDVNRMDGLSDVLVAINGASGSKLLVYEASNGALNADPEILNLPSEAKSLAIGQLDDAFPVDIAVAAGREMLIIHGRDRKHSTIEGRRLDLNPPAVTRITVSFQIAGLATGDFANDLRHEIALLSADGVCHFYQRASQSKTNRWQETSATALPGARKSPIEPSQGALIAARISSSPKDDLLFIDQQGGQLSMLMNESAAAIEASPAASSRFLVAGSFDTEGAPVAAMGMRLNTDAINDIVLLKNGASSPTILMSSPSATFTVINTNDSGAGSLRQAIISANSGAGADNISFAIPGSGTQTINLLSQLPALTGPTTLDGTTQSPGSPTPPIQISGASAGAGVRCLSLSGGNTTVRGLVINQFDSFAIELIGSSGDIVEGCFIGTNAAGSVASANNDTGILISTSSGHRVGGTTAAARNVISGNNAQGVLMIGPAMNNLIQGNFIGTNAAGSNGIGNLSDGVNMLSGASDIINCSVGGATAGAGNLISSNGGAGVQFIGVGTNNLIQGNLIGTDVTGTLARGNSFSGVALTDAASSTVGGTVAGSGNIISGNGLEGISVNSAASTGNLIKGNKIGTQTNGSSPLPNSANGVTIMNSASNNVVGGATGEGNIIAFNPGAGVMVESGTGNAIQSNSIFSNGGLGIDLAPAGVTPNDTGDPDTGANNKQNFPIITAANGVSGGGVNVVGTLNSNASATFTLHFYSNASCDSSGNGEGQTLLGSGAVTTNASGNATFNFNLTGSASLGQSITATATNSQGNTSEFSACAVYGAADLAITKTASSPTITVGSNVTYTVIVTNNGPDPSQSITVTDNLPASVIFVSCSSTGAGVCSGIGNNRVVTFASLASGSSETVTFVATLNCSIANGTNVTNTASISATVRDPVSGNNSSTANFTASKPATVLNPTSASFASDGGAGSVGVTFPSGCGWTAVSNVPWITVTSGALGNGNGTVGYSVAVNSTGSPRMGTITIAGQTFTVNQSNIACSFMISPTSNSFPIGGGSGSVTVTTQTGCIWKAIPNDSWITVPPDANGAGSGSFNYTVAANPGGPRTGTITIAGQVFTIMQAGSSCSYSIAPTGKLFSPVGSESTIAITTAPGCNWSASTIEDWILITSDDSGAGSGSITYAVRDNPDTSPRQGVITVAGLTFTVVQDGGTMGDCLYLLNPTKASFNAAGGSGSIQINTEERCAWEAATNVSWITFTSNVVGINAGTVAYQVAANPGPGGRSGVITIAGQVFNVKQK
jgi:uncharacterized repeat protein (TIGR01451 family)